MQTNTTFPRMHVSYYVSDITKTVDFYTAFFGQAPAKQKTDYAKFVLDSPSLIISFVQNPDRVQPHFGHLGFQVESQAELLARLEDIKANGLPILEEIGTNCCYATQDKFWITDPDGVQWEVYYFHADAEFNDPHYQTQEATACCLPPAQEAPAAQKELTFISLSSLGVNTTEGETCTPGGGCC
ncbi:ArsI/CadI family heavy metal resistance metalloenzyme [Rufibacter roseus]|uniref:ArsI/CadI family heavy metal resistance metalloenzyme n=1 Tax=Rufibacter roseus TaxID=1567108 RepID=A0ABW2DEL0_9BACT|nr:ArsI/CadI family heavy metal resistance metalloenzyme [Rufibacter roseus]